MTVSQILFTGFMILLAIFEFYIFITDNDNDF